MGKTYEQSSAHICVVISYIHTHDINTYSIYRGGREREGGKMRERGEGKRERRERDRLRRKNRKQTEGQRQKQ